MNSVSLWPSDESGTGKHRTENLGGKVGTVGPGPALHSAHKLISASVKVSVLFECFCQLRVQRAKEKGTKERVYRASD